MSPSDFELYQLQQADEIDAGLEADFAAQGRHDLAAACRRDRQARRERMAGIREYRSSGGRWIPRPATPGGQPAEHPATALRRRRSELLRLAG